MKSAEATPVEDCTWNQNEEPVEIYLPHQTTCFLTTNVTPPPPVRATATRIRNRVATTTLGKDTCTIKYDKFKIFRDSCINCLNFRTPTTPLHRDRPPVDYSQNTRCICATLWPRAWMLRATACTLSRLSSRRAWKTQVPTIDLVPKINWSKLILDLITVAKSVVQRDNNARIELF